MRRKWIKHHQIKRKDTLPRECEVFHAEEIKNGGSGVHSYTKTEDEVILRRKRRIKQALKQELKLKHINRKQFNTLKKRMNEISNDLVAFGSAAGVILGKKYVCGVIGKEDFEQIKCDLLPASLEEEKEFVTKQFNEQKEHYLRFMNVCSHDRHVCQKCHKDKMFYSRLYQVEGIKLCKNCFEIYRKLKVYGGNYGKYLICPRTEMNRNAKPTFKERENV